MLRDKNFGHDSKTNQTSQEQNEVKRIKKSTSKCMYYSLRKAGLVTHFHLENASIYFKNCLNVLNYDFHLLCSPFLEFTMNMQRSGQDFLSPCINRMSYNRKQPQN